MYDALVISDLHLGSDVCNDRLIKEFLDQIERGDLPTKELILNGDVFDSWNFGRLKKRHWKILTQLRHMSSHRKITWINGNHDGPSDLISQLLGVHVADEYILKSDEERILIMHGHQFDKFIDAHPVMTWLADRVYRCLQKVDKYMTISHQVKMASKTFVRCTETVEQEAVKYARKRGCTNVICGHTHLAVKEGGSLNCYYWNCGSWVEGRGSYIVIEDGTFDLKYFTGI